MNILQDVSIDQIMKISKLIANTTDFIKEEEIIKGITLSHNNKIIKRALKACTDLKIIENTKEGYKVNSEYIVDLKICKVSELHIFFRKALQNFPPFLLYVNLLNQGLSKVESAEYTKILLKIDNSSQQISTILLRWGIGCNVLKKKGKKYILPESKTSLPKQQLDNLLKSLDNEMSTKNYLIDILNTKTFAFLTEHELNLNDITTSLLEHEKNPKNSTSCGTNYFEHFLRKICKDINFDVTNCNGIGSIVKKLEEAKIINHSLAELGFGVNGCRIISNHGIDKKTTIKWTNTPMAALTSILFTILTLKSYYLSIKFKEYNF